MAGDKIKYRSFIDSAKEALIIVFSILVAFSLDAWWEDVKTDRDVDEILRAVEMEMTNNLASLEASLAQHEKISESIAALRQTIESQDSSGEDFSGAIIDVEVYEPSTGAMDTLVSTGLLAEVDDVNLQLLLGSYAALLQDLNEQETRAVEFRDAARRRLASNGIRLWVTEDRAKSAENIEVQNLLLMRAAEEGNAIESARALEEHVRKILTRLDESL